MWKEVHDQVVVIDPFGAVNEERAKGNLFDDEWSLNRYFCCELDDLDCLPSIRYAVSSQQNSTHRLLS